MNLQKKNKKKNTHEIRQGSPDKGETAVHGCHCRRVIWLCACVRYLPYGGVSTCAPVLIISFALKTFNLGQIFFLKKIAILDIIKWNSKPQPPSQVKDEAAQKPKRAISDP